MKQIICTYLVLFFLISLNCKKEEKENTVALKGIINFLIGDVKLIDTNGDIRNAGIGDEIIQGMKIETRGKKSIAEVYFGENIVKILGNTLVEVKSLIENIESETREVKFFVGKGRLFSRVKRKLVKGDIYEVATPTTTAGVRGTDFLVTEEDGKANVACISGLVAVLNNSMTEAEPVVLNKKEETDIIKKHDRKAVVLLNISLNSTYNIAGTPARNMGQNIFITQYSVNPGIFAISGTITVSRRELLKG